MAKATLLFQSFNPFKKRAVFLDGDRADLKATIAEKRGHIKEDRQEIKEARQDFREAIQEKRREIRERAKTELRALRTEVEATRAARKLKSPERDLTGLATGEDLPDSPEEVEKDEEIRDLKEKLARAEAVLRELQTRPAASPAGDRASATGSGRAAGGEGAPEAATPEGPLAIPADPTDLLAGTEEPLTPIEAEAESTEESYAANLDAFSSSPRFKLPEEFKGWKDMDYAQTFRDLDNGVQAIDDLNALAKISGKNQGSMDLWNSIRKRHLNPNSITLSEITGAVLGRSAQGLRNRYERVQSLLASNPKPEKKAELEAEKARYDAFIASSLDLVRILDANALSYTEDTQSAQEAPVLTPEQEKAARILEALFPKMEEGPEFRGAKQGYVTMERYAGRVEGDANYSPEAAYTYLYNTLFTRNADGQMEFGPAEQEAFAEKLEDLMKKGLTVLSAQKNSAELAPYKVLTSTDLNWADVEAKLTNPKAQELIQAGMSVEFTQNYAQQRERLASSPLDREVEGAIAEFKLNPEDAARVREAVKTHYLATAGLLLNADDWSQVAPALDLNIPLTSGGRVVLHLGFNKNPYGETSLKQSFDFHTGVSGSIPLKREGDSITLSAGVNAGTSGVTLGAGLDGRSRINDSAYSIEGGLGAGIGVSPKMLGAALYASIGFSRDMGRVLEKKTEALAEQRGEAMQEALGQLKAQVTPEVYAAMERDIQGLLTRELGSVAIDKLAPVQFLGLRVGVSVGTTGIIPIIGFGLAIKGKPYSLYSSPDGAVDLSQVAEADIRKALEAQDATLQAVEGTQSDLTGIQEKGRESLAQQNLDVTEVAPGLFRMDVAAANGSVDVYTAPGIESFIQNGVPHFRLDKTDTHISIRRVNTLTPFRSFGAVQHVEIFITGDSAASNESIKKSSKDRIHYMDVLGTRTDARIVQNRLDGVSSSFASADALTPMSPEELAAQEETITQERIEKIAGETRRISEARAGISDRLDATTRQSFRMMAESLMKGKEERIDYKKLSTNTVDEAGLKTLLTEVAPNVDWNNQDHFDFMLQALMEASLNDLGEDPAKRLEHITGWNQKRLTEVLGDATLAKKVAERLAAKLKANPEYGKMDLKDGSIVQIEVGTDRINGYRTAVWEADGAHDGLLGGIKLDAETLQSELGLTADEASVVIERLVERTSPLSDKPADLLASQLGRELLEVQEFIFNDGEMETLGQLATMESVPTEEVSKMVYEKFKTILETIRRGETYTTPDGIQFSLDPENTHKNMGFYEKCMNFTVEMQEGLLITIPETSRTITETIKRLEPIIRTWTSAEADVTDQLIRTKGVRFFGLGMGVAIKAAEAPNGSKNDGGDQTTGDVEDRDPNQGGISTEPSGPSTPGAGESAPL